MHIINAHFHSLEELPAAHLFGEIGVYVIWSPRADVRPTYLGEGQILGRFAQEHIGRFGEKARGYVALMSEGTEKRRKSDAEILEAALLFVGEVIGQRPAQNRSDGKRKPAWRLFDAGHGVIRLNMSGYHPLRWNARLPRRQEIKLEPVLVDGEPRIGVTHPWRRVG
jgi:hypothetical protein